MSTAGSTGPGATSTAGAASTAGVASTAAAAFMGWGDSWRSELAKGSTDPEKELKRLERFESPVQVYGSFREMERRMSSGELRTTLKKDATSQEIAAWRKENGIPETPEAYKVNMPEGRQAPKEDDAFLKAFLKSAHDANYTQGMVDATIRVFYAEVDRQERAMEEAEKKATDETEEKLRQEWGPDYRPNKAMAEALLARAPAGFRDRFMNGYLSDHRPIKASVEAWKWLVQLEREINPAATVVPGQTTNLGATVEARINELKGLMGNPNSKYWKGAEAPKLQEEYRKLVEARDKMAAKAA